MAAKCRAHRGTRGEKCLDKMGVPEKVCLLSLYPRPLHLSKNFHALLCHQDLARSHLRGGGRMKMVPFMKERAELNEPMHPSDTACTNAADSAGQFIDAASIGFPRTMRGSSNRYPSSVGCDSFHWLALAFPARVS